MPFDERLVENMKYEVLRAARENNWEILYVARSDTPARVQTPHGIVGGAHIHAVACAAEAAYRMIFELSWFRQTEGFKHKATAAGREALNQFEKGTEQPPGLPGIFNLENEMTEPPNEKRVVVLTALPVEHAAVKQLLSNVETVKHAKGTIYEVGKYRDWLVALVETGPGNIQAAVETERAITHFKPTQLIFVGVAGGIKDVDLGDVVAATKIYRYASGKDTKKGFLPRPELMHSSYELEQLARHQARNLKDGHYRAIVGPIAAGERVVAAKRAETAMFLAQQYGDAVAVEMEGDGFLSAAHANQDVKAIVIRGISDKLDHKDKSDAENWQEKASRNAAEFALGLLDGSDSVVATSTAPTGTSTTRQKPLQTTPLVPPLQSQPIQPTPSTTAVAEDVEDESMDPTEHLRLLKQFMLRPNKVEGEIVEVLATVLDEPHPVSDETCNLLGLTHGSAIWRLVRITWPSDLPPAYRRIELYADGNKADRLEEAEIGQELDLAIELRYEAIGKTNTGEPLEYDKFLVSHRVN